MGCASSKLLRKDLSRDFGFSNSNSSDHVVSLTSTTYGFLQLDRYHQENSPVKEIMIDLKNRTSPLRDKLEIIDTWELMKDLEEEDEPFTIQCKNSIASPVLFHKNPLKLCNHMGSPKKSKNFGGKENQDFFHRPNFSPKRLLKESYLGEFAHGSSPIEYSNLVKSECSGNNSGFSTRRNLSPLFDPELVAFFEKELSEEEERIKKMIFETPDSRKRRNSMDVNSMLNMFERKCPPGGENTVVVYTTTLRGIRKTFESCNTVRSILESHDILFLERDISMDLGFKEEFRRITGIEDAKVPVVFVKGRLLGGVDEIVKLEDEEKLGILFNGMPRGAAIACDGCAGVRFIMCMDCYGSCKVLSDDGDSKVKCLECNENGLIQCPICC